MSKQTTLLLLSWSVTTIALAIALAAVYVNLSAPAASPVAAVEPDPAAIQSPLPPPPVQALPPPPLPPPLPQADPGTASIPDVVAAVLPSVVSIESQVRGRGHDARIPPYGEQPGGTSTGSGVIVSADGLVVTNHHVVEGAVRIQVHLSDGRAFGATVVGSDELSDIALLRMTGERGAAVEVTPVQYGDSSHLRLGDTVLAIGNPFGVGQTVTMGIVSAVGRADLSIAEYEDFIQTDAAINPGNSGGALISTRGELVGINTAILSRTGGSHGIGFAIPTNMVRPIVDALLAHGQVRRGWLGVGLQEITPELATAMRLPAAQGVLVSAVEPESPAATAGVLQGDLVEQLDSERVTSSRHLRSLVATRGANAEVTLTVVRGGARQELHVTLGERPIANQQAVPQLGGAQPPVDPRAVPPVYPGLPWGGTPYPQPQPQVDPRGGGGRITGTEVGGLVVADLDARLRSMLRVPPSIRHGAVVVDVQPGSAGARTGITQGDIIVQVDGQPVTGAAGFQQAYAARSGNAVLLVRRGPGSLYVVME